MESKLNGQMDSHSEYSAHLYVVQNFDTKSLKYCCYLKRLSLQLCTFFEISYFRFKSFVKVELSYVFTINLFTIAENCTEN